MEIARATSDLVDGVVIRLFADCLGHIGNPGDLLLIATGGYGRRELAPHSDVDLLMVTGDGDPTPVAGVLEPFLRSLWDLGLEPGAATRTTGETLHLFSSDPTSRTSLLDRRLLHGDENRWAALDRALEEASAQGLDEWIEAKIRELGQRRERFGGTVHLLEPNVKQSAGGLRDLQTALWIGSSLGILPTRELKNLEMARERLWKIRIQLHYLTGRKEDHLTFHLQEEAASALGYHDREPDGLAVEQFMRDYYLAASTIERLADEVVERSTPTRQRPLVHLPSTETGLALRAGRLAITDRRSLWQDPSLFVRLFTVAERLGVEPSPRARDLVRQEAPRIDDVVRADPRIARALLDAFEAPGSCRWLQNMHREGILGALLPEFGRVTARHQHDLYHVYTVDIHTVFAMRRLGALLSGNLASEEPHLSAVARQLPGRLPLSLGVLFHDVGKGLGGHHSQKGAALLREVCRRLGVTDQDTEAAVFLVSEHLTMSHVSQRRDLSDPELIRDFAVRVGNRTRLDMLYLLTYVDVASVGPGTWTRWKASLLAELYEKVRAVLEGGESREQLLSKGFETARVERFLGRMPGRYFAFATSETAPEALLATERYDRRLARTGRPPLIASARGLGYSTRILVATGDRPGLLASIAGVLAAHRIDVLRADVFSTADGVAIDFFVVEGPLGGELDRERWRRARRDLAAVLEGRVSLEDFMARKLRPSGLPARHMPSVRQRVSVDNESSSRFTVIDVFAEDRRGLLYAISSALHRASLVIGVARIATEGNQAIDSFYVSGPAGEKIVDPERIRALEAHLLAAL